MLRRIALQKATFHLPSIDDLKLIHLSTRLRNNSLTSLTMQIEHKLKKDSYGATLDLVMYILESSANMTNVIVFSLKHPYSFIRQVWLPVCRFL